LSRIGPEYEAFSRDHPKLASPWYRFYRTFKFLEKADPCSVNSQTRWLDIGCNSGAFLRTLVKVFGLRPEGCDVYPIEDKLAAQYECFKLTENSSWRYSQADVSKGLDGFAKFNVISALEVIEHLVDTDRFLDEIWNHLTEDGLFVVTTPNINNLRNRLFVPFGRYPIGMEYRTVIHHVRLYNVPAIRSHFAAHGLQVLALSGVQMLPERWVIRHSFCRALSEFTADMFPQLAPNMIVIARKVPRTAPSQS
jgi:2-polyprenyl-3-methyl-5-hydroxy-6-metoxy-1,4-benzoquinol methylase